MENARKWYPASLMGGPPWKPNCRREDITVTYPGELGNKSSVD
jgi:hypothetical protein